jgi:predicted transcriptional regulator
LAFIPVTTVSQTHRTVLPVRERREQLGVSRATLAARAGCSVTYLQTIEAGVVPQLTRVMPRLEAALVDLEAEHGARNE